MTTSLSPVYIAAPYGAATAAEMERNTARAELLGTLALRLGHAPIVVHSMIHRGVFGDDGNPRDRGRGIAATVAILRVVRANHGNGGLWVLLRDDGTMSPGVAAEVAAWAGAWVAYPRVATWADWRTTAAHVPDLLPAFDALATPPEGA